MTDRKKRGLAFWATVALVMPMLYIASFGPACWITSRMNFGVRAVELIYWPLTWAMLQNRAIGVGLASYAQWGAADGWAWINDQSMLWWANLRG